MIKPRLTQLSVTEAETLFDARDAGDLSVPYFMPIPGTAGYWADAEELRAWRSANTSGEKQ
jgi:hypothetical protein